MPLKRPRVLSKDPIKGIDVGGERASTAPSGRGISGGSALSARIDYPNRRTGEPPLVVTSGSPSSSPDVNASELMQNMIMNDDDKEWYALLFKKMNKRFLKPRSTVQHGFEVGLNASLERTGPVIETARAQDQTMKTKDAPCLGCHVGLCTTHIDEMKQHTDGNKLLLEPDETDADDNEEKDEFCSVGGGAIAGYQLPLGASNQSPRKRRKGMKRAAKTFGGGKIK